MSPDPSESAQGCAARHVTGCSVPLNRHATTTGKRYRVGRQAASGLGQAQRDHGDRPFMHTISASQFRDSAIGVNP